MKLDDGELVATGAELAAAPAVFNFPLGELARVPRVSNTDRDAEAVKIFFNGLSEDFEAINKAAIATLANPSRIGVFHYTLGEESISRAILAWGKETADRVVLMVSAGGGDWRIRVESVDSLMKTISSVLMDRAPLLPVDIRSSVTQEAALVFLAALHLLRESRMLALISHHEPATDFTVDSVEDVLNDSGTEDFRWPFFFFDKVLPFSTNGVSWSESMASSLKELAGRDLVREVKGSQEGSWQLTPTGYRVFLATHHHLTKVGLRVTELNDDGLKGHEGIFLIRSMQDLFLFDLAGKEAVIASVDMGGMETLVRDILAIDEVAADALSNIVSPQRSCPACASRIPTDALQCPVCGISIAASAGGERPQTAQRKVVPPPVKVKSPIKKTIKRQPPRKKSQAATGPPPLKLPITSTGYCAHCGGEVHEGTQYCGHCGKKINQ